MLRIQDPPEREKADVVGQELDELAREGAVLLTQTSWTISSRFSTSLWSGDNPHSGTRAGRFAAMATRGSIRRAPDPLRSLALLGEPLSQILLPAEVHLVWCTTAEKSSRDLFIVLTDVEGDETPHRRRTVEEVLSS